MPAYCVYLLDLADRVKGPPVIVCGADDQEQFDGPVKRAEQCPRDLIGIVTAELGETNSISGEATYQEGTLNE
jgi:hypothetical protein